jgi:hypothetical protein
MGIMTEAVMKYAFAPVSGLFSGFNNFFLSLGRARAAAELSRMGYHQQAKNLMTTNVEDL